MIPIRDENPTQTTPYVVYLLIVINVLVFLAQVTAGTGPHGGLQGFTMVPYEISTGRDVPTNGPTPLHPFWLTIFTSMFMHAGLLHIGGNMLYLWIFGNNIEDTLGHAKFLFFYLACGFCAALVHILSGPYSPVPTLGASGAIAGVLGAYVILFPGARITSLVFLGFFISTVDIPAVIVLGIWFLLQFLSVGGTGGQQGGGVAYWAHIGGFISGMILILLLGGRRLARPRRSQPYYDRDTWYER